MRTGKSKSVSPADRRQLQALVKDRNAAQKHVWQAEIVLFTADAVGTNEIMRRNRGGKLALLGGGERFRLCGPLVTKRLPSPLRVTVPHAHRFISTFAAIRSARVHEFTS